MRAVDTPIGKVVVLAPTVTTERLIARLRDDHNAGRPMLVAVEVACPTCEGKSWIGSYGDEVPCLAGCGSGTVSVPHVVTDVLPILSLDDDYSDHRPQHVCISIRRVTIAYHDGDNWCEQRLDLPDARPGGVVLVVEPKNV